MKPNIATIKTQIHQLHELISAKIAERENLTAQIEAVNSAPPDRESIIELLHSFIDEQAANYPSVLRQQIAPFLANWSKGNFIKQQGLLLLQNSLRPMVPELGIPAPPHGILYLLQEPIKQAVIRAVDEMDLPEGLGTPERQRRLTELTNRLAALDSELHELFNECEGLGITLPSETLSPAEKEIRRRAAVALERSAKEPHSEMITTAFPGDEPRRKNQDPPRSAAYEAVDLPAAAFDHPA